MGYKEGTSTSLDSCLRSERERERGREGNVEGELKREKQEKICRLETHSEREREREREGQRERESERDPLESSWMGMCQTDYSLWAEEQWPYCLPVPARQSQS